MLSNDGFACSVVTYIANVLVSVCFICIADTLHACVIRFMFMKHTLMIGMTQTQTSDNKTVMTAWYWDKSIAQKRY